MQIKAPNSAVQHLTLSGNLPSKRPRSTSVPSSPTGSASSKRAISEDDFPPDRAMRNEGEGLSGSSPMPDENQQPVADAGVSMADKAEQDEVEKRTEDMHIGESGRRKYEEIYNDLLSKSLCG